MAPESQERNPYVGPRPFEPKDSSLFFGRDWEADELVSLVVVHPVVLFYAQSGAGKTSLLNAKLIPLLEEEGFEVLPLARVSGPIPRAIEPDEIPNLYAFNTLMSWAEKEADPRRLARVSLADFLKMREHPTDEEALSAPRVVIFDQFEELFAYYPERWRDREKFFEQVGNALEEEPLLRVVFVVREDYIAQLDPYVPLLPEKLRTRFRIERLRREAALAAVKGPLKDTRHSFAEGAAEQLVEELLKIRVMTTAGKPEVVAGEFVEPVQLQVVCQSLWQDLPSNVTEITKDDLQASGDVNQALSEFYERSIRRAAQKHGAKEADLREWFEQSLITPAGTRGTVFRGRKETGGVTNTVVNVLENLHLIRGEWRAGARWYELTHDRFIGPIQRSNETWHAVRRRRRLRIGGGVMAVLILLLFVGIVALQAIEDTHEAWQTWRVQATATAAAWQSQATATVAAAEVSEAKATAQQSQATATVAAAEVSEAKATAQQSQTTATVAAAEVSETRATATVEAATNEYVRQAFVYVEQGDYEQAIADYTKAIELDPGDAGVYYYRGFAYTDLGNYEKAIADYIKAGNAYRELGDYEQAVAAYTEAIELNPNYAVAYFYRGLAYVDLDKYDQAVTDYTKAIELDPNYAAAYNRRGLAYNELKEYALAISDFTKAVELDSDLAFAYSNRGWAYSRLENYELALQDFKKSVELNPNNARVYYYRGLTYANLENTDNAISDLEMALQLSEPPLDETRLNAARSTLERLRAPTHAATPTRTPKPTSTVIPSGTPPPTHTPTSIPTERPTETPTSLPSPSLTPTPTPTPISL